MISVLLTILKIIGIILLAVLGLLVLAAGLVLFVPVRYQIAGRIGADMAVSGKISWFLSGFCFRFSFEKQGLEGQMKIFGVRLRKKRFVSEETLEEDISGTADTVLDSGRAHTEETVRPDTVGDAQEDMPETGAAGNRPDPTSDKKGGTRQNLLKKSAGRVKQLYARSKDSLHRSEQFFVKIKDMLTNPQNRYAIKRLWAELCYLLKHFRFRRIHTDLIFSLADPALTGQALGVLCMIPFFYQYDFHICPDFESEQYRLEGTYEVKGSMRLVYLCITAIRLLEDAAIRDFFKKLL